MQTGGGGTNDVVATMQGDVGVDCRRRVTLKESSLVVTTYVSRCVGRSALPLPLATLTVGLGFSGSILMMMRVRVQK